MALNTLLNPEHAKYGEIGHNACMYNLDFAHNLHNTSGLNTKLW